MEENNIIEAVKKLASEINENNFQEKSKEIRNLILKGRVSDKVILEIEGALEKLGVEYVSVRSSAVSEDSLKSSFAGLYDTFLNVRAEAKLILENVKKCWASLFNDRAVIYRIKKRIPHLEGMAVIIQEMIPAEISGVTFTMNPDTGDKALMIIESSWGLGDSIASGIITPDRYIIVKENLKVEKSIVRRLKTHQKG